MLDEVKQVIRAWVMENVQFGNKWNIAQHLARVALYELKGLDALHPQVRSKARELVVKCAEAGVPILIASNPFRTIKRQQELYDQGRTSPGSLVTNAKPLESYHCYALSFDIVFEGSSLYLPLDHWKWKKVGEIGESIGLIWGGHFNDMPHFEYHPEFSWEELKDYFKWPQ